MNHPFNYDLIDALTDWHQSPFYEKDTEELGYWDIIERGVHNQESMPKELHFPPIGPDTELGS